PVRYLLYHAVLGQDGDTVLQLVLARIEEAAAGKQKAGHVCTPLADREQSYRRLIQPPMPLLEVRSLARSYYGVHALRGVDLSAEAGHITGLIGPNGAGKTTLFNCISGLVPPDAGSVWFDGRIITGWRPDRISAAGLVRTFQI